MDGVDGSVDGFRHGGDDGFRPGDGGSSSGGRDGVVGTAR
jgi:hypothetical protein